MKVVFLGTGSGKPAPERNVSSVALQRDGAVWLFDCGEGTQTQLARSPLRPGALAGIAITHFHGDHVNGLPGLIGTLGLNERSEGLRVIGPRGIKRWFATLRSLGIMNPSFPLEIVEVEGPGVVWRGEGWRIEADRLRHRVPCFGYAFIEDERPGRFDLEAAGRLGVPPGPLYGALQRGESIETPDGRRVEPAEVLGPARPGLRIAYCCDTEPCQGALRLGRGADLLIHEATYPAGDEALAHARGHSTSADAARCAAEAGALRLAMTHLSQKHLHAREFLRHTESIFEDSIVAHDLLEVEVERREA